MKVSINPTPPIIIEFEGVDYPCRKPLFSQAIAFESAMKQRGEEGNGGADLVIDHLVNCGLPREMVLKLDGDQVRAISEALLPAKKNSQ